MAYRNLSEKAKNHSRQKRREWYANNKERDCLNKKLYRKNNFERIKLTKRVHLDNLKMAAIVRYSNGQNNCAHCGESTFEFLTLDHINNDGGKHRKSQKITGSSIYQWVKMNNYPPTFQILCYNCNFLKIPRAKYVLNKRAEQTRKDARKAKKEVLSHYSNNELKCVTCGHEDYRVLTIDHINGGGHKQIKELGYRGGKDFYAYLRREGFPPGYRVLCFNCNSSRIYTPKTEKL